MKYQVLFSLKNNEKVFINVVCCSRDWQFKGLTDYVINPNLAVPGLRSAFQSKTGFHCTQPFIITHRPDMTEIELDRQ